MRLGTAPLDVCAEAALAECRGAVKHPFCGDGVVAFPVLVLKPAPQAPPFTRLMVMAAVALYAAIADGPFTHSLPISLAATALVFRRQATAPLELPVHGTYHRMRFGGLPWLSFA